MLLIGVNRSPYTRRVAVTLKAYGLPFEQRNLSGFGNRAEVRAANPLGRIPALVLDNGETLVDSAAIIDHLDEVVGREGADAAVRRRAARRAACRGADDGRLRQGPARRLRAQPPSAGEGASAVDRRLHDADEAGACRHRGDGRAGAELPAAGPPHSGRRHHLHCRAPGSRAQGRHRRPVPRLRALYRQLLEQEAFRSTEP